MGWVDEEISGVTFGDERLNDRYELLLKCLYEEWLPD